MLNSISIVPSVFAGYIASGFAAVTANPGTAVSKEAAQVSERAGEVLSDHETSQALFGSKQAALSRLAEVACEGTIDGAIAADPAAVANAKRFILVMPDWLPLPDFSVEPDGSIALDWTWSRNQMFYISIGTDSRFAYAWKDGARGGHAVDRFDGKTIPSPVLQSLTSVIYNGATLRAS